MKRLMYVSTARPGLTDYDIDEIVANASTNNRNQDITGILAFNGTNFAQILEGEEFTVDTLYTAIKLDGRHEGIITVGEREVGKRAFPEWGMRRVEGLEFDELIDAMAN